MNDIAQQIEAGSDGPGFGHNSGASAAPAAPAAPADVHRPRVKQLVDAANVWLKVLPSQPDRAGKPVRFISNDETARRAKDFWDQARKEAAALGAARKAAGKPHRDAIDAINADYEKLITPLDMICGIMEPLHRAWLQRLRDEQSAAAVKAAQDAADAKAKADALAAKPVETVDDMLAAELATKNAADAEAAAAIAAAAKAHVVGDFSARASGLRSTWRAHIEDYPAALAHFANESAVRDVVQQLADKAARTQKAALDVPGCVAVESEKAV